MSKAGRVLPSGLWRPCHSTARAALDTLVDAVLLLIRHRMAAAYIIGGAQGSFKMATDSWDGMRRSQQRVETPLWISRADKSTSQAHPEQGIGEWATLQTGKGKRSTKRLQITVFALCVHVQRENEQLTPMMQQG